MEQDFESFGLWLENWLWKKVKEKMMKFEGV